MSERGQVESNGVDDSPGEAWHDLISPVTGSTIDRIRLATPREIALAASRLSTVSDSPVPDQVFSFLRRLRDQLVLRRDSLVRLTIAETGFIQRDGEETVDGAIDFLGSFETYVRHCPRPQQVIQHSYSTPASVRTMRITSRPFGVIAAVVPQNASLSLGITMIASALFAGARILLRPSLQTASTGAVLAGAVTASDPPAGTVEVVNCLAGDFIKTCCATEQVDLIHYVGSNQYALGVLTQVFSAGKVCILDGQGNGLLYVDESYPPEDAARLIAEGATRFNGETCTSVNGVLVEKPAYERLKAALMEQFEALGVGDPFASETRVGPLFSEQQAQGLRRQLLEARHGRLLFGGEVEGAYFKPAIVSGVTPDDALVHSGFFGPAVWIQPVSRERLSHWVRCNRFPLSDTVLSMRGDVIRDFANCSRAARVCVNADPSVESMFEPWGGYPPSGLNPVSLWVEKYRQAFQLDGQLDLISEAEMTKGHRP